VHRAARPGATLLLSAFSDVNAEGREWPRPMVSEEQLRQTLGDAGWDIAELSTIDLSIDLPTDLPMDNANDHAVMWMLVARR